MSTVTRPRGPLPPRVYWVRRALVLATVFAIVFAVGRAVGGSDGEGSQASPAASRPTASGTPKAKPTSAVGPVGVGTGKPSKKTSTAAAPPAQPDGPCNPADITVTPTLTRAAAGRAVTIGLELSGIRPACTFLISARSLAVRISQGPKRIWTSQQCPTSISRRSIVVRSADATAVEVRWSGRKSDPECRRSTGWALPGPYRVIAAVIGSEPGERRFTLTSPPRPVITETVTPKPEPKPTATPTG